MLEENQIYRSILVSVLNWTIPQFDYIWIAKEPTFHDYIVSTHNLFHSTFSSSFRTSLALPLASSCKMSCRAPGKSFI